MPVPLKLSPLAPLALLSVCLSSWCLQVTSLVAAERPNILFAIADDWGCHAGAYGTPWVKTPAFDRIAREGLLFNNAYTPMAKCAPSRAIVLTGRHLWQNEEAGNHLSYFPAKLKCWPEVLMEHGWHMGFTGKGWGPGSAKEFDGKPRAMTGKPFNTRKQTPSTSGIGNNNYAENFKEFLDTANSGAPWCFWYGSTEPHRDYEFQSGVKKGGKKLSDIPSLPAFLPDNEIVRHDLLDYAYEVEHTDSHLGMMISELERRGQLDNTLIIVTSDHGMPFPRCKGYAYECSNHVPLAIRWPRGIKSREHIVDAFVSFIDIAPTILDYAEIAPKDCGMMPITGKSWRDILEGFEPTVVAATRDHTLLGKERTDVGRPNDWGYPIRGLVTKNQLYLKNYEPSRWPAGNPETGYTDSDASPTKTYILELGRQDRSNRFWKSNFGMRPMEELYDLKNDRDCTKNLATDPSYTDQVTQLRERMESELKSQGDPRMFGEGKVFDLYPATNGAGFYDRYLKGENPKAGWINASDIEKDPLVIPN